MVDIFDVKPIPFNALSKEDQKLLQVVMKEERKRNREEQKQQREIRKEELRKMYQGGEVSSPKIEIPKFHHRRLYDYKK
ncbi:MAG: hypothetical protein NZ767_05250 [SAR86 cluster bacterium]|jgi:TRAP-type C4-dicarboxylate transport system substrate-binding protein|nr:hypothetical protein [SAR86 cluster bacterium]|tara:strand:+ start:263 stop:499 length:237 start_codon:yes stop_codon:yes gene_type:complete